MRKYNRIFVIVLDSLGIGETSDSKDYGDVGADTLRHISESVENLKIPNLQKLGLANLHAINHVDAVEKPLAYFMKMREASIGKDTMTGHWEMMGLKIDTPFNTFTDTGFPEELLEELKIKTGHNIVGNKSASGTEILDEFGEHQMKAGDMIVYTSADSVLQICGHEETFGLEELYRCCKIARELTFKDEWKVGRVIARPYVGMKKGDFKRTSNRHDYALKPYGRTALDILKDNGLDVISVGKISDIFDGEGITESNMSKSSVHGMEQTIEIMDKDFNGLCFVNLVDFDALWGHRRNPVGYAEELEKFDVNLGKVLDKLREDDLLIITADHGTDPTYTGTDHTREYVPFLAYSPSMAEGGLMETSSSFAAIGATIADNFQLEMPENTIGESVLEKLI
ncbi:MAG: phosphopentomutase [Clostridiaceae bacterium]